VLVYIGININIYNSYKRSLCSCLGEDLDIVIEEPIIVLHSITFDHDITEFSH
jgi:hypothetical protein